MLESRINHDKFCFIIIFTHKPLSTLYRYRSSRKTRYCFYCNTNQSRSRYSIIFVTMLFSTLFTVILISFPVLSKCSTMYLVANPIQFIYSWTVMKLWKESLNSDGQPFHQYQQNKNFYLFIFQLTIYIYTDQSFHSFIKLKLTPWVMSWSAFVCLMIIEC